MRYLKYFLIFIVLLLLTPFVLIAIIMAFSVISNHTFGRVDFEEDTSITMNLASVEEPIGGRSPLLSSVEDMELYLRTRKFRGQQSIEGDSCLYSLDYEEYDFIITEGKSISHITNAWWDECSTYASAKGRYPISIKLSPSKSQKVYVYRITPKGKYREGCFE